MKKKKIISIFIMSVILLTGCSSKNSDNSNANLSPTFQDVMNSYIKYNITCEALNEDVIQVSSGGIQLSDGTIYEYNKKKYSSTNTNCRVLDVKGHNFITIDSGGDGPEACLQLTEKDGKTYCYENGEFLYGTSVTKAIINKVKDFDRLYFYGSGNIYVSKGSTVYTDLDNKEFTIENENITNVKPLGGILSNGYVHINNEKSVSKLYVVTNKNYYICQPKLTSNCEYVDQECDYEYTCKIDERMNPFREKIKYYDGIYLIDVDGKLYIREY